MSRSTEATGKTVAEATARALRELGISTDQAEITVVARGRRGLFGIFPGTPARVRVCHRQSNRDRAETIVRDLLRRMDMGCHLDVVERRHDVHISIETAGNDSLLIGKGGVTLHSLEYLVNRMLQNEDRKGQRVVLEVGGYRAHGDEGFSEDGDERRDDRRGERRGERRGDGRDGRGEGRGRRQQRRREQPRETQERQEAAVGAPGAGSAGSGGRPSGRRRSGRGRRRRRPGGGPKQEAQAGAQGQG